MINKEVHKKLGDALQKLRYLENNQFTPYFLICKIDYWDRRQRWRSHIQYVTLGNLYIVLVSYYLWVSIGYSVAI